MKAILQRIGRLAWLAASGPGAWKGAGLYVLVMGLNFFGVWVSVQMINWQRGFFDALEQLDAAAAIPQVWLFFWLVGQAAGAALFSDWLEKRLRISLRERLTGRALDQWLNGRAYWYLRPGLTPYPVDNPDQRVAEDCRQFILYLLEFSLDLVQRVVSLVTYLSVLWGLSHFPLAFAAFGYDITIPRYMVWLAFIYVAAASTITHLLGKPLKSLNFRQERVEADFRYALVQIREGADQIAQSGGENAERRRLDGRFEAVKSNWRRLIGREFILGLFTVPYHRTVLRVPTFFALPAYFGGAVTLGGLMQTASSFSSVTTTLSWFIFSYRKLAQFVAVSERLDGLFAATRNPQPAPDAPREILRGGGEAVIAAEGLVLYTPQGRALDPVPDFTLHPGERLWISGASGRGKTTFLSAVTGVWPYGRGRLDTPAEGVMALPQVPLPFAEGVMATLAYPADPATMDRAALEAVLARVGLAHRIPTPESDGPAALQGLSIGERQRLALARALVLKPRWLLLDEATSALDASAEAMLLALLRAELPETAILCVAHRPPHGLAPYGRLDLGGQDGGEPSNDDAPLTRRKTA